MSLILTVHPDRAKGLGLARYPGSDRRSRKKPMVLAEVAEPNATFHLFCVFERACTSRHLLKSHVTHVRETFARATGRRGTVHRWRRREPVMNLFHDSFGHSLSGPRLQGLSWPNRRERSYLLIDAPDEIVPLDVIQREVSQKSVVGFGFTCYARLGLTDWVTGDRLGRFRSRFARCRSQRRRSLVADEFSRLSSTRAIP